MIVRVTAYMTPGTVYNIMPNIDMYACDNVHGSIEKQWTEKKTKDYTVHQSQQQAKYHSRLPSMYNMCMTVCRRAGVTGQEPLQAGSIHAAV